MPEQWIVATLDGVSFSMLHTSNCTSLTVAMATPQHAPARAHARRPVTRFP